MNRLQLDNPSDASNTDAHWSPRPGTPPVSIYDGFWGQDQPDVTGGACVTAVLDDDQHYDVSWMFVDCAMTQRFVCEAAAGLQGSVT